MYERADRLPASHSPRTISLVRVQDLYAQITDLFLMWIPKNPRLSRTVSRTSPHDRYKQLHQQLLRLSIFPESRIND